MITNPMIKQLTLREHKILRFIQRRKITSSTVIQITFSLGKNPLFNILSRLEAAGLITRPAKGLVIHREAILKRPILQRHLLEKYNIDVR